MHRQQALCDHERPLAFDADGLERHDGIMACQCPLWNRRLRGLEDQELARVIATDARLAGVQTAVPNHVLTRFRGVP